MATEPTDTEPTDEELLERRHKALAKQRENLLANRAQIDQDLSKLDIESKRGPTTKPPWKAIQTIHGRRAQRTQTPDPFHPSPAR